MSVEGKPARRLRTVILLALIATGLGCLGTLVFLNRAAPPPSADLARRLEQARAQLIEAQGRLAEQRSEIAAMKPPSAKPKASRHWMSHGRISVVSGDAAGSDLFGRMGGDTNYDTEYSLKPGPYLNAWLEERSSSLTFSPLATAAPGTGLTAVLDLAAIAYRAAGIGFASVPAGNAFREWLKTVKSDEAQLKVLIVPSERYFLPPDDSQPQSRRVQTLSFPIEGLKRALRAPGPSGTETAFEYLQANRGNADWLVARQKFQLQLRSGQALRGLAPAVASVAFLLWVDDPETGVAPIGSVVVPLCVSDDPKLHCSDDRDPVVVTLDGPKPLAAALQLKEGRGLADAALHFVELDRYSTIGVFRCNSCPGWGREEYVTWTIDKSAAQLTEELRNTILDGLEKADQIDSDSGYLGAGTALFNLLFDPHTAQIPRARFVDFMQYAAQRTASGSPPKLFVRLLASLPERAFIVPVSVMAVKLPGARHAFLGDSVQIESPLPNEDYRSGDRCISRWTALVPPGPDADQDSDQEMNQAREQISTWLESVAGSPDFKSVSSLDDFGDWMADPTPESESLSVLMLSHHEPGRLFFNDVRKVPAIYADSMVKYFKSPSLAIIAACGAAKPGAFDVIRQLNQDNITTVIAASTSVDRYMAAQYVKALMGKLNSPPGGAPYTVGAAHFAALRELAALPRMGGDGAGRPFGPAALVFSVLGNSNLKVCGPRARPAAASVEAAARR